MTLRLVQQTVVVVRKGTPMSPPIGSPFDFTDDEIAQIEDSSPDALSPVNIRAAEDIMKAAQGAGGDGDGDGDGDSSKGKPGRGKPGKAKADKDDDDDDEDGL